jgi:N-acetylmuramoyl-L-alanine amidase
MRLRAVLLNVLVIAPVATAVGLAGSSQHAQAAGKDGAPQPISVVLDPGHGGKPNNADPSQPFDPGAIGVNGVLEKDVTLAVAQHAAELLRADLVNVRLTRNDDRNMSIQQREDVALAAHAALFVSIHCNSLSEDATVGGSLVLYPGNAALGFAKTMSDALARDLAVAGVQSDGVQLRDTWWIHATMPTVTVEMAYLSNRHEAALMATDAFRWNVAQAIRDGIERYEPDIAQRKAAIIAWRQAHQPPAPTSRHPAQHATEAQVISPPAGSPVPALLMFVITAALTTAAVLRPAACQRLADDVSELAQHVLRHNVVHHGFARRRRRRIRILTARHVHHWAPRSVYDELSF